MIPAKNFGLIMLCNIGDAPLQILSDSIVDIFIPKIRMLNLRII